MQDQVKGAAFDGQQPDFGFFQYAAESYSYFLAGDDQKCQDVEDKLAQEANEQQDAARAHIEALQQASACRHKLTLHGNLTDLSVLLVIWLQPSSRAFYV